MSEEWTELTHSLQKPIQKNAWVTSCREDYKRSLHSSYVSDQRTNKYGMVEFIYQTTED